MNLISSRPFRMAKSTAERAFRSLHHDRVELALGEPAEQVLDDGEGFGAVEIVSHPCHFFILRILGSEFVPSLGAQAPARDCLRIP